LNRLTLALDVMGGDIGPRITIPASLSALEADPMLSLVLFGDSQQISPLLENAPSSLLERIQIHQRTRISCADTTLSLTFLNHFNS
jgi:phosphate acyltransferase